MEGLGYVYYIFSLDSQLKSCCTGNKLYALSTDGENTYFWREYTRDIAEGYL